MYLIGSERSKSINKILTVTAGIDRDIGQWSSTTAAEFTTLAEH